ncbi:MAG: hypothetical protein U0172_10665 [Nitrospiraceae bacterium]
MSILDHIDACATRLRGERDRAAGLGFDRPLDVRDLTLRATVGTLFIYHATLVAPDDAQVFDDTPITVVPADGGEPTEGLLLCRRDATITLQLVDSLGSGPMAATIVPDVTGLLETVSKRLSDIASKPHVYTLGPAERLNTLFDATPEQIEQASRAIPAAVVTTQWNDSLPERRTKLATLLLDLIRHNKKVLLIGPDAATTDDALGAVARATKAASLPYKSHLTRYDLALAADAYGVALGELGFEAQMHQFFAKARADKAALRRKYERFRELTPILAYKAQKQQELDEVRLLEWRLMTQLTDLRTKIAEIDTLVANYEALPIWKRLTMQTVGKNVATLGEYNVLYAQQAKGLEQEVDIAKARIAELVPEAAVPRDMRPEYDELKEEVVHLGGTKKIREMLAAEEGTNRQAFIQNRRIVATTAARAASDPLFAKVRFDVLVVVDPARIHLALLLGAAALVRERLVLNGTVRDFPATQAWATETEPPTWLIPRGQAAGV